MTSPLYRKPAPPRREDDAHASALRSRLESRRAQAQRLPEVQAHILLMMRARLDELAKDGWHNDAWKSQRALVIRQQAQAALDAAEESAMEALEDARSQASQAATRDPGSIQEQQLLELQIGNAWMSLHQYLESAAADRDPLAALERVADRITGDRVAVEALRRFGQDYVASRFGGETKQVQERIQAVLTSVADRAEAPTLTPVQVEARAILADIDRGLARLQVNSQQLRTEINGKGQAAALAEWQDGAAIRFGDQRGRFPAEAVTAAFSAESRAWAIAAPKAYPLLAQPAQPAKPDLLEQLGMQRATETFG